jgi:hypothetical protein
VQQESSGNLVPALGGKNLAARKSKEKKPGSTLEQRTRTEENQDRPLVPSRKQERAESIKAEELTPELKSHTKYR